MRDADPVIGEASGACLGSGSVDTQARRVDFWSTSRDSGPTATVSYRRRRPYAAPDATTEDVAPKESMGAAASAALTESDAPEAPIEAMPSEAPTEAVAEAPVEVLATDEPMDAAQDELTETAAPVAPLYAPAPEAAPEETRAPKRGRKPKALTETAAPEAAPEERLTPKTGQSVEFFDAAKLRSVFLMVADSLNLGMPPCGRAIERKISRPFFNALESPQHNYNRQG